MSSPPLATDPVAIEENRFLTGWARSGRLRYHGYRAFNRYFLYRAEIRDMVFAVGILIRIYFLFSKVFRNSASEGVEQVPERGALSPAQSRLLFAIWTLDAGSTRRGPITSPTLADFLHLPVGRVQKLIHEIELISPDCFVTLRSFNEASKRGRPLKSYHLNQEGIATFPETALLLIELAKFPSESPYRVNRAAFEQHMTGLGMDAAVVSARIDANIRVGYIREHEGFSGHISPTEKIECERNYLDQLAAEFKPGKFRTSA